LEINKIEHDTYVPNGILPLNESFALIQEGADNVTEIPTPKPYIFMIRATRQIKCLIAKARGGGGTPYLK
jgi:hypothetical protein